VDQGPLLGPALLETGQPLLLGCEQSFGVGATRADREPGGFLARDDVELGLQRLDAAARILDLGRRGVLAHRQRARRWYPAGSPPCPGAGAPGCSGARASPRRRALRREAARDGASRASRPRRAASAAPSARSARAPAPPGSGG